MQQNLVLGSRPQKSHFWKWTTNPVLFVTHTRVHFSSTHTLLNRIFTVTVTIFCMCTDGEKSSIRLEASVAAEEDVLFAQRSQHCHPNQIHTFLHCNNVFVYFFFQVLQVRHWSCVKPVSYFPCLGKCELHFLLVFALYLFLFVFYILIFSRVLTSSS